MQTQLKKINRIYTIDKNIFETFKSVAEKDMRKLSNIIEQAIIRYIRSKS